MWYEWYTIRGVIHNHVKEKNFDQLEVLVDEVRTNSYKFFNSKGVLYELYNVIVIDFPDYQAIHDFIGEWRAHNPKTNIPDILEARAHHAQGGEIRGNGYASLTSDEQFSGFEKYLKKSLESARKAEQKGPMDAELCRVQISLSFVVLKDKNLAKSYFEQCKEIDLSYIHTYYTMRMYLQRIWYGSDKELQRFIEQAATDTQSIYGEGLYAMLIADHTFNTGKIYAINGGPYSWPRAKAGFQHLIKKFGPSSLVWHVYGYSAMLAEDYPTFAEILKEIGTAWDDDKQSYFKKQSWYNYHLKRTKPYLSN